MYVDIMYIDIMYIDNIYIYIYIYIYIDNIDNIYNIDNKYIYILTNYLLRITLLDFLYDFSCFLGFGVN